ncbi:MAG: PaaI family thioesterase [Alphaproteobacteria bacterium]
MTEDDSDLPAALRLLGDGGHLMLDGVPHAMALGFKLVDLRRDHAIVKVPYREELIGNPETGVIHGGVITSLLDNTSGLAVICALDELWPTATLDLRIDYMRPARPHTDVFAHAHCYKVARSIAFVRAAAYEETEEDPVATSHGAFMLKDNGGSGAAGGGEAGS